MCNSSIETTPQESFVLASTFYQELLAEREEILRYKWIESEKQGRDIGFGRARIDWTSKHREGWRLARSAIRRIHRRSSVFLRSGSSY